MKKLADISAFERLQNQSTAVSDIAVFNGFAGDVGVWTIEKMIQEGADPAKLSKAKCERIIADKMAETVIREWEDGLGMLHQIKERLYLESKEATEKCVQRCGIKLDPKSIFHKAEYIVDKHFDETDTELPDFNRSVWSRSKLNPKNYEKVNGWKRTYNPDAYDV